MRVRRHTRRPRNAAAARGRGAGGRRLARDVGVVAGVFALGYLISTWWVSPSPLLGSTDHAVPYVIGLPQAQARDSLVSLGLRPRIGGERAHPTLRAGVVAWQDPPAGVILSPNGAVVLALSAGSPPVAVPDVIGLDSATAARILAAAGVKVGEITTVVGGREAGIVIATRPGTGVTRPRGAPIGLVLSRGPEDMP